MCSFSFFPVIKIKKTINNLNVLIGKRQRCLWMDFLVFSQRFPFQYLSYTNNLPVADTGENRIDLNIILGKNKNINIV